MHAEETRALKRATLILIAVSAARWGWSLRMPSADAAAPVSALPELIEGTADATGEGARRQAPLTGSERLDPNRASDIDLDRLPGVGPSTASAILAARDSGAVFRRPEDLLDVRGIGEATLERMRPWLTFGAAPPAGLRAPRGATAGGGSGPRVDLNRADQGALEGLPGVGPAIARRIIEAREERMFTALEDLERVPGIGLATIERLRPYATVGPRR